MDYGIRTEDRANGVRVLSFSNSSKRNALDETLIAQLSQAIADARDAGRTGKVRALLLRAEGGKAFCSGYDLATLGQPTSTSGLPDDALMSMFRSLEQLAVPTVALVEGLAFGGGCHLAACCDFRVGNEHALFCLPPAKLGIVYAPEGLHRMGELVGATFAKRMFLTGQRVNAERAFATGLLDELTTTADAHGVALSLCDELAAGAPLAVQGMKQGFLALAAGSLESDAGYARLRREAFSSGDAKEGRLAMLEKRLPVFTGR